MFLSLCVQEDYDFTCGIKLELIFIIFDISIMKLSVRQYLIKPYVMVHASIIRMSRERLAKALRGELKWFEGISTIVVRAW